MSGIDVDMGSKIYNHLVWLLKSCDVLLVPANDSIAIITQVESKVAEFKGKIRKQQEIIHSLQLQLSNLESERTNVIGRMYGSMKNG